MEFVVGASEATMKSVLGKLGALLAQEYAMIRGIEGDIQYINDELASIQAFLGDLSSSGGHDRRLKDWMKQIRDMAYDMEDCIDDFSHRIPHDYANDSWCFFVVIKFHELRTFLPRREICSKVANLKVRAQQIAERRDRYGVNNPGNTCEAGAPRSGDAYDIAGPHNLDRQLFRTEEPVGMRENVKEFTAWLTKYDGHFEKDQVVLSIVGFGGMGKTTIATALYRDYRNEFDCRAIVTVSQNYDECKFLREILGQIKPKDSENEQQGSSAGSSEMKDQAADENSSPKLDLLSWIYGRRQQRDDGNLTKNSIETMKRDQLIEELKSRLSKKRYILLIDDIWSADTWEKIRNLLQNDNTEGSRIIVTTRFQSVAEKCSETDATDRVLTVGALTDEDSETLFNRCVCASKSSKDAGKEEVHKEMWKYCGGLPLALVTMAGLVACNPTKKEEDWNQVYRSLQLDQSAPLTLDGVKRILDYCYNDLPVDLKTCSLFLCIFPKGSKVSRKRLIRRWISERFASEKQGMTEEEVAEAYFDQLIRRNIIRPVEHSSNGKIKSFKVHDMVLEYIVSKSCEENFITVVGGHWLMPMPSNKVRRLSMQSTGPKHGDSTKGVNLSQVRSLTVFGNQNRMPFRSFNDGIIQVLDLDGWNGLKDKHLLDICKMLVLKFLSLRRTGVKEIPSQIGKLQCLETLDIRETNVQELPRSAGELNRLRCLHGGSKNPTKAFKLPQQAVNKEPMAALGILSGIEIDENSTTIESLHQMTGLRKLAIYKLNLKLGGQRFKQLRSSIEYLCSCGLQTLAINDEKSGFIDSLNNMSVPPKYLIALELSGKLMNTPNWIKDLKNLYKITLSVTVLRTATFQLLQNLPKLFSLTFSLSMEAMADRETLYILDENKLLSDREIIVPPGGFRSLKLLRFFATLVPRLSFRTSAMPNLERIDMRFKAFEGIYGIEMLGNLQELHLSVDNQADDITRKLVEDLKYTTKFFVDKLKDTTKRPKIIMD